MRRQVRVAVFAIILAGAGILGSVVPGSAATTDLL